MASTMQGRARSPSVDDLRRSRGDHAAEQAAQGGAAGRCAGERRSGGARRSGAGAALRRVRRLDARRSASGSTPRAATSSTTALPRRPREDAVSRRPRHQGRGRDARLSRGRAGVAESLCRLIEHSPDLDAHPAGAGRPARRRGARHRPRACAAPTSPQIAGRSSPARCATVHRRIPACTENRRPAGCHAATATVHPAVPAPSALDAEAE